MGRGRRAGNLPAWVAVAAGTLAAHGVVAIEPGPAIDHAVAVNGAVSTVATLPSGAIAIGGRFGSVRGGASDGIAVLDAEGTAVPGFAADCRGPSSAATPPSCGIGLVVAASDGSLIVDGTFAGFGPSQQTRLAKLDATTGAIDPAWAPFNHVAAAPIQAIASFDGRVVMVLGGASPRIVTVSLAGAGLPVPGSPTIPWSGALPTIAPPNHVYFVEGPTQQRRVRRLRLDTGTVDPDWQSREFRTVEAIAWDPDTESVLVAGAEPFSDGLLGRLLIRIRAAGGAPEWPGWNVFQFTVSQFRRLLVSNGVLFADACGANFFPCTVRRIPLSGNGQSDPGYPGALPFGFLPMLAVDAEGRVFLDPGFSNGPSPSPDGSRLVRLTPSGVIDTTFRPRIRANSSVSLLAPSRSGDIVLFGGFRWVGDQQGDKLLRLRGDTDRFADWRPFGPTCEPSVCESTTAIAADQGNRVFIATSLFIDDGSQFAPSLRRYQPEGETAEPWHEPRFIGTYAGSDARIDALVVDDANGWLYIAGRFEGDVCGQPRRNLARVTLAAPCRADPAWRPDPDDAVESLQLDAMNRLVAGGAFLEIAGQPIAHLARFDGVVLDATWRPIAPGPAELSIPRLAITEDHVFAEVRQTLPGSTPNVGLLRFAMGAPGLLPVWSPPPAQQIDVMLAATNGRLFVVRRGVVPSPFASAVDRIEVFDAAGDGTPAATLPLASGQRVLAGALRSDGSVLIGGPFNRIANVERTMLATIHLDPFRIFGSSFE